MTYLARLRPRTVLVLLAAFLVFLRLAVALAIPYPFIFSDELFYWLYAHEIQHGQWTMTLFGQMRHYPAYVYPLFLALVTWPFSSPTVQFWAARLAGIAAITSAAALTYRLARACHLSPRAALWAAALAGAVPGADYGTQVMAEAIYYPLLTALVLSLVRLEQRPTAARGAAAGALLALAVLTKPQALLFLPLLPPLFAVVLRRTGRRPAGAAAVGLVLAASPVLATRFLIAAREGYSRPSLAAFLGYYALQAPTHGPAVPSVPLLGHAVVAYAVLFLVVTGAVPAAALIGRRSRSLPAALWLSAAGGAVILILVFARNTVLFDQLGYLGAIQEPALRLMERYLFPVLPGWAVAFAATLESGVRRGRAALGGALSLLVAALGFKVLTPLASGQFLVTFDAPSLSALYAASQLDPQHVARWAALAFAVWAVACGLFLTARAPAPVFLLFCLVSLTWPSAVALTSSPSNWAAARALIPWVRRTVPAQAAIAWDASQVPTGVTYPLLFFTLRPLRAGGGWVRVTAHQPVPPGAWLLTTAATAPRGSPARSGLALVPPGRLRRAP